MNGRYDHRSYEAIAVLTGKRIGLQCDLKPWPSRYRLDALPTEL